MEEILKQLPDLAQQEKKANKKFFQKLSRKPPAQLDALVREQHDVAFEEIDCLACANCCKTTSPIFRDKDIDRIARHLKIRPVQLVQQYLHMDADGDYVLNQSPCVFLGADNYCSIYEARPKACREYPHTDRKKFHQILSLTLKNTSICPAVFNIVKELRKVVG